jgi:hypothetical protein
VKVQSNKPPTDQMLPHRRLCSSNAAVHRSIHVRPLLSTHWQHAATEAEQSTFCSRRQYLALTAAAVVGLQLTGQAARPAAGAGLFQTLFARLYGLQMQQVEATPRCLLWFHPMQVPAQALPKQANDKQQSLFGAIFSLLDQTL